MLTFGGHTHIPAFPGVLLLLSLSQNRNSRHRRHGDGHKPRQQHSHGATGGDASEDETAFDYGDDFNSDVGDGDDDGDGDGDRDGDDGPSCVELSSSDDVGGDDDDDGVMETDDLDDQLRMALMSTPSDVPTHRPSQCKTYISNPARGCRCNISLTGPYTEVCSMDYL